MQITQILAELEEAERQKMQAVEGVSPLQAMDNRQQERQLLTLGIKRPKASKIARQLLAADPEMRPLLQMARIGTHTEEY
jgi:hypothetical protein